VNLPELYAFSLFLRSGDMAVTVAKSGPIPLFKSVKTNDI
jgi:hypothetical protein